MINEIPAHYVTKEVAMWLKDIGFDVPCNTYWQDEFGGYTFNHFAISKRNSNCLGNVYTAPEYHQVIEWIRLNTDIEVEISHSFMPDGVKRYKASVYKYVQDLFNDNLYPTPRAAIEAAVEYIKNNNLIK